MNKIKVMVNGLPGNVASTIAKHVIKDDRFELVPYSLTGPDLQDTEYSVEAVTITLVKPDTRDTLIHEIKKNEGPFITVDYTHPTAVDENVDFYCKNNLPFVLGTTGGNREKMRQSVTDSSIPAIIAPNMAKQIVGLQAMMEYAANTFPGLFKGYSLDVKESHQSWKADTSGTAKAIIRYFNQLGIPFTEDEIQKERDPEAQKNDWGIPEEYLDGHGWHTYTAQSSDKTSKFVIKHNINGREIYAEGTLDGVEYLHKKINEGVTGKVFSMIDVLKQK